ncbi:putative leucine-rich repeat-containing protein DDB_G0290503 [Argopecten irradians]|uniref:putative leucine-rich repeat-containing protein DDB_G0290503 n=1 Tax=Argopecten irradians TaxID=31199 RepID=UPI00371C85A6
MDSQQETPKRPRESFSESHEESPEMSRASKGNKKNKHKKKNKQENKKQKTLEFFTNKAAEESCESPNSCEEYVSLDKRLERIETILSSLPSKSDLQNLLTREQHEKSMRHLEAKFNTQIDTLKHAQSTEIEKLDSKLLELEHQNRNLEHQVKKLTTDNENFKNQLECLFYNNEETLHSINDLEQHGRANSIRISGVDDRKNDETVEETVQAIITMCKGTLNLDIDSKEIDVAHRLGSYTEKRSRNIICKFVQRRTKFKIMDQLRSVDKRNVLKNKGITIRDDTTSYNQSIIERARQCPFILRAWCSNGKIKVKTNCGDTVQIISEEDLDYLWGSLA